MTFVDSWNNMKLLKNFMITKIGLTSFWFHSIIIHLSVTIRLFIIYCNVCLVQWEFWCLLMTITKIFMINSFLTVISDLYDSSLSSGSTVSFFNISSWSLIEYVFSGIYLTSLLDLFDFPLSSGSLSDVSLFLSLEYFSFSEFSLCSGWFFHYINVFPFSKNKGNILNNLDQSNVSTT